MILRVFIHGDGPEMREAKDIVERLKETSDIEAEILDAEDREGKEVAKVYDIYTTPSFLLTTDEGVILNSWIGRLPAEFELKAAASV